MAVLKVQSTLRLDADVYAKLRKIADSEMRSVSNMIDCLVRREIEKFESKKGKINLTEEDLALK